VLTEIYGVSSSSVGLYLLPFAVGNFLGPLLLGRFFDSIGRKPMIAGTYILSGILLIITGLLFKNGTLTATTQTIAWCVIFFFASAGASAAYLTVSEIFPMETRAMAIAFFYATGTIVGGFGGPLLFGALIQSGSKGQIFIGYLVGAVVMISAGRSRRLWASRRRAATSRTSRRRCRSRATSSPRPARRRTRTRSAATRAAEPRTPRASSAVAPPSPHHANRTTTLRREVTDEPIIHLHAVPRGLQPGRRRERVVAAA
jgi:MFS family permease